MKNIILLMIIAMPIYSGIAQNTIKGTIVNAENNAPLDQVSVYFPALELGNTTNNMGYFEINDLPDGTFELIVSQLGFETYAKRIDLGQQSGKSIEIKLMSTAIEMEEVIVSTPFHKLQSENVMKVERSNIKELKSNGAVTLVDGISKIAGVENISTGLGIGKPVIRGLSANRVLVYSQGIRIENQQFGDEHGLGLDGAGIESVEVIKGPASLLYGSDAMGGVLYFNPEKFAMPGTSEADALFDYYSNTNGLGANVGYKISKNQLKFLVRGSYNAHTDYKTGNGERLTNSRFNTYDLKAGIGYQTSSMKTELRYNLNASELGIPEEIGAQTRSYIPITPNQQIYNHVLSSKTKLFLKNSSIEAILGYTNNNRKEFEEDLLNPALEMHLATFNYNLRYELPNWGDLETLVGVQGMRQTNENFGEEQLIPDAKTKDIGVFATSHLHIGDKSGLQLGLRYDHRNIDAEVNENPPLSSFYENLNRDFHSFNSSVGYKFNISKNIESRINLASGFRAPNLAELTSDGVHEGTNRYEIGNNELNNEQNFQTDVSLEFKNDHIAFFINGFYNTIKDYIFIEPDGTFVLGDPVFLYTQQNASLQGGEIGFHLHPHPLDWLHFESSFETVIGKKRNGGYLPLIPANSLTNTLRVEMGPGSKSIRITDAFLSLKSVFDQTKIDTFETSTPGYNLVHLGLGLTMQNIEIRVGCNNVFNQNYISHLSRLKIDGIANIGRNITVSAAIPI